MRWISITVALLTPTISRAETAVVEQNCHDIQVIKSEHAKCVLAWHNEGICDQAFPLTTSLCWDFETGELGDTDNGMWTTSGLAFNNQPTFGDNVTASRALTAQPSGLSSSTFGDLHQIGGDYWQTPYPIGNEGHFWVGTYEDRHLESAPWAGYEGEEPQGKITSPTFVIDRNLITFLIGGACDISTENLQLQVNIRGTWVMARVQTGTCSDLMERKTFDTSAMKGSLVRLVVSDSSSVRHINIDHVLHTDTPPIDVGGANRPLWGFADTHSHPGNHLSFQALVNGGQLMQGAPEDSPGIACDGGDHGQHVNLGSVTVSHMLETTSFGTAPAMPAGCEGLSCYYSEQGPEMAVRGPYHDPRVGAPYWYTRTHQQMYVDWMQRAYQGGQRILVVSASNNEALGSALRSSTNAAVVSDFGALRRFAAYIKALVPLHAWMEIARTPADARRIVRANKLAIILSTEVDDLGDNCAGDISSTSPFDDGGFTMSTWTSIGVWNQVKVRKSCGLDDKAWVARVQSLYDAGYRLIIPMHFANNDLGGAAVYDDLHSSENRYANAAPLSVMNSSAVTFRLGEASRQHNADAVLSFGSKFDPQAAARSVEVGWCTFIPGFGCEAAQGQAGLGFLGFYVNYFISLAAHGLDSPVTVASVQPVPQFTGEGHVNSQPLTAQGRTVLMAMKDRGMLIDVAHMDDLGRDALLGLGATKSDASIVNPGCDLTAQSCLDSAYPVIASHAGLRDVVLESASSHTSEGGLRDDTILRIRDIGGTVAVGTSGGDARDVDAVTGAYDPQTGAAWSGIFRATVPNDCAGSSRTFAQGYFYVMRRMRGRGITLGTDINGLEAQLNPRFGSLGCYARGNVPRILQYAHDGTTLIDQSSFVPFRYEPAKLTSGSLGTAGGQRIAQRKTSSGINYSHYGNTPPIGPKFVGLWDPSGYISALRAQTWLQPATVVDIISMLTVSKLSRLNALIAPSASSSAPTRTFDFNYDGLANYGMIPDMLQDLRVSGLTQEQLGPLFRGAEDLIETWERSCRMSNPTFNKGGCR